MVTKKIPMRTCVATKECLPKVELFRVVRTPEGQIIVDLKGKANGRGAYLKKDALVILKAQKSKVLEKHLECSVPQAIYDTLLSLLDGQNS